MSFFFLVCLGFLSFFPFQTLNTQKCLFRVLNPIPRRFGPFAIFPSLKKKQKIRPTVWYGFIKTTTEKKKENNVGCVLAVSDRVGDRDYSAGRRRRPFGWSSSWSSLSSSSSSSSKSRRSRLRRRHSSLAGGTNDDFNDEEGN